MKDSPFLNWPKNGPLDPMEITDLFGIVARDLADAAIDGLSLSVRLCFAFNAALICAKIALRASALKVTLENEEMHKAAIASLSQTMGIHSQIVERLQFFREKRDATYFKTGLVSDGEISEIILLASELHNKTKVWVKAHYPNLVCGLV